METKVNLSEVAESIKGEVVANDQMMNFWSDMLDGDSLAGARLERFIFTNARRMCTDFNGGQWKYVVLDKDAKIFYLYPNTGKQMQAEGVLNHASESLTPELFGLITTMLSLAWHGDITGDEKYYSLFHKLREFTDNKLEAIMEPYEDMDQSKWTEEARLALDTSTAIYCFLD
ncbi:antirestriction protein [uncultured Psychrobacter sp.]|uniref:antirestriction protein n=1 Tax=uncultured Psychrobacter sp. TaxID=259303 RepID=UPI0030DCA6EA